VQTVAPTQAVVFAVLQGLAAVFPIGLPAHFALLTKFTGWALPGPAAVTATQAGVLLALLAYFGADLFDMAAGLVRTAKGKRDPAAGFAARLLVAAIIAIASDFLIERYFGETVRTPEWTGWLTVGGALLLLAFDRMSMTVKRVDHATFLDAVLLGLAQAVALLPGMLTSGAPVTVTRFLGYERDEAVKLSILAGVLPLIAVLAKNLIDARAVGASLQFGRLELIAGAVSFVMALASLASLMSWLRRSTFAPFAVYRLLVGAAVVVFAYGWIDF
jgi:undecaprenyl-diphosphatase